MRYFLNKAEVKNGVITTITICAQEQDHLLEIDKPSEEVIQNLKTSTGVFKYDNDTFTKIENASALGIETVVSRETITAKLIKELNEQGVKLSQELIDFSVKNGGA